MCWWERTRSPGGGDNVQALARALWDRPHSGKLNSLTFQLLAQPLHDRQRESLKDAQNSGQKKYPSKLWSFTGLCQEHVALFSFGTN